ASSQKRPPRATRAALHRPACDPSQPPDTRPDVVVLAGTGRHQPAQHLTDGNRLGLRARVPRKRHRAVPSPTGGGSARGREHLGELIERRRRRVSACRPCDDPTRLPRNLHLDHARLDIAVIAVVAIVSRVAVATAGSTGPGNRLGLAFPGVARPRGGNPSVLRLEIGEYLLAPLAAQ